MFRVRVFPVAAVLILGLSLSACSGMTSNFDPTEWITGEFFDTRQKLPGERKPVFPDGVPGVSDGVPKEMVKGNQQQQAAIEPETPPPAAKPAPKPRAAAPAPKPRTASAPPARPAPAASQQPSGQPASIWPDPNAAQQQPRARTAPPPADSQANWPPPDATTFSR